MYFKDRSEAMEDRAAREWFGEDVNRQRKEAMEREDDLWIEKWKERGLHDPKSVNK